jgi:hypothetical protein
MDDRTRFIDLGLQIRLLHCCSLMLLLCLLARNLGLTD